MLLTHGLQGTNTPHITSPASLDALPNPGLFLLEALVKQRVLPFFFLQRFFLEVQVAVVGGSEAHQLPAVQLYNPGRHPPDKRPIMADKQHGAAKLAQGLFQPGDRGDVQVVCRLIQQQNIRVGNQSFCQENTALPASREGIEGLIGINAILTKNGGYLLIQSPAVQGFKTLLDFHQPVQARLVALLGQLVELCQQLAGFRKGPGNHFIGRAGVLGGQVLRQHRQNSAIIETNHATIGCHFATDNLQQGRFSLAVSSQQTHTLSGIDNQ